MAKPGDAHITVASEPRCELLVDGVPYGNTPLIDLAVPAGKHTIVLLNSAANIRETQEGVAARGRAVDPLVLVRRRQDERAERPVGEDAGRPRGGGAGQGRAGRRRPRRPKRRRLRRRGQAGGARSDREPRRRRRTAPKPVEGAASGAKPAAVASMAPAQKPRNVAARTLDSQQISHADPQLPAIVRSQRKGTGDARFAAKVCVGNDGQASTR